MHNKHRTNS